MQTPAIVLIRNTCGIATGPRAPIVPGAEGDMNGRRVVAALRSRIRDSVARVAAHLGVSDPKKRGEGRLTIATFHRVLPAERRREYPLPGLAVTPEELDFFLRHFVRHYTVGTLATIYERFRGGERPEKPFLAVTFDDGQLDNYVHARPVLERYGVRATFYLPVDGIETGAPLWHDRLGFAVRSALLDTRCERAIREGLGLDQVPRSQLIRAAIDRAKAIPPEGRRQLVERAERAARSSGVPAWAGMMTWRHVRDLVARGHEMGSHSMTHPLLPQCSDEQLLVEIEGSRAVLEERIEAPVTTFCYPNGDCDPRSVHLAKRAGYRCAVTTRWGTNEKAAEAMALRRCDMHPDHARFRDGSLSTERLSFRMSGLSLPLR